MPSTVAVGYHPGGYATSASQDSLEYEVSEKGHFESKINDAQNTRRIIRSRHHELAAHLVKLMPALYRYILLLFFTPLPEMLTMKAALYVEFAFVQARMQNWLKSMYNIHSAMGSSTPSTMLVVTLPPTGLPAPLENSNSRDSLAGCFHDAVSLTLPHADRALHPHRRLWY